jgi:hypothetical protein
LEVCLRADSKVFEVFLLSLLPLCLSPVFLLLELQRTNVEHQHVLSAMRLDVAAKPERFFAKELGRSGMRWGYTP